MHDGINMGNPGFIAVIAEENLVGSPPAETELDTLAEMLALPSDTGIGTLVHVLEDDSHRQFSGAIVTIVASDAGDNVFNGPYAQAGTLNGKARYEKGVGYVEWRTEPDFWIVVPDSGGSGSYSANDDSSTPIGITFSPTGDDPATSPGPSFVRNDVANIDNWPTV